MAAGDADRVEPPASELGKGHAPKSAPVAKDKSQFWRYISLAEEILKAQGKGAVAAFSPSGLSLNAPAHQFHKLLLEELFNHPHPRLGDAVLAAQGAYAETGSFPELLTIYHLFGDPAMTIR